MLYCDWKLTISVHSVTFWNFVAIMLRVPQKSKSLPMNLGLLYKWSKSCDHGNLRTLGNHPMVIPKEMESNSQFMGPQAWFKVKMYNVEGA